ncbi:hypothetical protein HDV00_003627 [Rhizophlyctis rosea]|nr:hypothetical protein HDV00_003627 [Rhizophlyctis rosea]
MPCGSISSSPDTVGIAVVNYKVPICESKEDVMKNCEKIAGYVDGLKRGYPGLDLVVFPEYSTQGFHPTKWNEFTSTLDGPEVAMFKEACKRNDVWGIFSLTGEHNPDGPTPYNTLIMISPTGETPLVYRKIFPWVPQEPWTPGTQTAVAVGPKGLIIGASICYDLNLPELMRDTVMKGAELVVRIQGYMYPSKEQQINVAKIRAWENLSYVAVANLAGRDLVYSYFGHSNVVGFDGVTIAECGTGPDEATYAEISISAVRSARRNWTAENHLYNLVHRGYRAIPGGLAECPFDFYKNWATNPSAAKETAELLTRDADSPTDASGAQVPVMPMSRLAQLTLSESAKASGTKAAAGGDSDSDDAMGIAKAP